MQRFDFSVSQHHGALSLLAVFWLIASFAWKFYRHRKRGVVFPTLDSTQIRFNEGMASGNSDRSIFTRLGGARRCLRVTVTDHEVWIRPFFPFNLISESDLEHRIARDSISSARLAESTFGHRVLLDFRLADGKSRQVSLVLQKPNAFLSALKGPPPLP